MPDYFEIYNQKAEQYDLLVKREDYQHILIQGLNEITTFEGADVVEFGAGTGRLTCLLAPLVRRIRAYDSSRHMLDKAAQNLSETGKHNWTVEVGDHRHISAENQCADAALSGWSMVYLALGDPQSWRQELEKGLAEMRRVVRENGTLIIIETLGTGHERPHPPAELDEYFGYLEQAGFQKKWMRTDYLFRDMEEAHGLTSFFFGEEMLEKLQESEKGVLLPECTGMWWQKKPATGS